MMLRLVAKDGQRIAQPPQTIAFAYVQDETAAMVNGCEVTMRQALLALIDLMNQVHHAEALTARAAPEIITAKNPQCDVAEMRPAQTIR